MRLLLCFLLLSVPCHSQVETAPTQSFLNLLGSVSAVRSASIFPDRIKIYSPDAPPAFLDDQRFRAFAATDLSQGAIDTTLRHANDAYELWMGSPYYGKNQAKAIYIMITGEDLEAGAIANREYCDHLIDTGFAVADWCDLEMYIPYVTNGGAGISSMAPVEGFHLMIIAAKDGVIADGYKQMVYHEMFHIYQHSNVFTDSYDEVDSKMGRMSGDNPGELVAWWMEGHADFLSALYSRDADGFKDEMRCALECTGPFSVSRKEKFFDEGLKLRNISWEQGDLVDLGYRMGSWFAAYLTSVHGEEALYEFWETVDEMGFEDTFLRQFGVDYRTYLDEFEVWLRNPNEELYVILDDIIARKTRGLSKTLPSENDTSRRNTDSAIAGATDQSATWDAASFRWEGFQHNSTTPARKPVKTPWHELSRAPVQE